MVIAPSVTLTVKAEQFHIQVAKFTLIGLANDPSHRTFDMIYFFLYEISHSSDYPLLRPSIMAE